MLEIQNLSFVYDDKTVLKNLSFNIDKNNWVSIMGHNGSGKSTLAKILVGLLEPFEGNVLIDSLKLNYNSLPFLRNKIGMVFQNPDYQFIGHTVKDDIAFGLENQNLSRNEIIKRVYDYSEMVGMSNFLNKNPQELSGGQKQKVAIASVLAMQPEIIIFDEVTAFLDNQSKKEIENIIKKIKDKIVITITHDLDFASKSDEIIVLSQGKLVKKSKPEIILENQVFVNQYSLEPTLALKIYYEMQKDIIFYKDKKIKDIQILEKMKEILWLYNLKK
ncbi:ABC-type cobalt transport system, ATPase component [Candidatus Phytoplasma mali]|uniref:ABC-type cobalt transport system, ATPase component n=1 Tax=Phytoplasma mali (strain AT) TaxID=482235 RepID=B3R019_PHYMT|nr:ATP-binding cassette domain-containing protein [Candidatus Phytoplasma mali]CAP18556.1 ABC-type cobalt transport system, ATPase component [Candidatus Phytoplasma mali]